MPEPLHFQADGAYLKICARERVVQDQIHITDIFFRTAFLDFKAPHFWSRFITAKNVLQPFMQLTTQSPAVTTTAKDEDKTVSVCLFYKRHLSQKLKIYFLLSLFIILRHFG